MSLIETLLTTSAARQTHTSMAAWFDAFNQNVRGFDSSIDRAIMGGRLSKNMSFAFASGYQSALESLFSRGQSALPLASLCVTEEGGVRPKDIKTTLFQQEGGDYVVNGQKKFVSGANDSQHIFVACNNGVDVNGRGVIKVVSIPSTAKGIEIIALPTLPFIPLVSHGKVILDNVEVGQADILSGDGYSNYVKPFRTYEDLHVLAAILGFRLGEAIESRWGDDSIQAHLPLILSLQALSSLMPLQSPAAHISLAACREELKRLIALFDDRFEANDSSAYIDWKRDKLLLSVANKANEIRTNNAWKDISTSGTT